MGVPTNKVSSPRTAQPRPSASATQRARTPEVFGTQMSGYCQADAPSWITKKIADAKRACTHGILEAQRLETSCGIKGGDERPLRDYGVMLNCVPIHPSWKRVPKQAECTQRTPGWVSYLIYTREQECERRGPLWRFKHIVHKQWCGAGEGWWSFDPATSVQSSCTRVSSEKIGGY